MYYIGIDLGGTNIAVAVVDEKGKMLYKKNTPTLAERHYSEIIGDMARLCGEVVKGIDKDLSDIKSIGIGSPGNIDSQKGLFIYANNFNFQNVSFRDEFKKFFDIPVFIDNDANCAALGESVSGACKGFKNSVMLTLGTGIGGGIIIDGKIYSGSFSCGGEIGHMVIERCGRECSCGRYGCFESYCSTAALTKRLKEAVMEDEDSEMFKYVKGDIEEINTKLLFSFYKKGDYLATDIVEEYAEYLAEGITNVINIFQPEAVVIGGGISAQGNTLLRPVIRHVKRDVYGGVLKTEIIPATLGNDAGIIGAAMLGKDEELF